MLGQKKSAIRRKRTISSVVLEKRLGCANLDARTGRDILSTSRENNIYYDEKNWLTVGHNRITITGKLRDEALKIRNRKGSVSGSEPVKRF